MTRPASRSLPVDPERRRFLPKQGFGWIDRRFFRDGYASELSTPAVKLYAFLCSVADSTGHSWYGDALLMKLAGLRPAHLGAARRELCQAGLLLFGDGIYRLLALPPQPVLGATPPPRTSAPDSEPRSLGEILKRRSGED